MGNEMNQTEAIQTSQPMGRRGLLRLGGMTIGGAALLAACRKTEAGTLGRVGEGPTNPVLADPIVDNGVLLRTLAGVELSIVNAYQRMLDEKLLQGTSATFPAIGDLTTLVTTFQKHHVKAATTYNRLATDEGAESWDCGNTHLDAAYLSPIFDRVVLGVKATDNAKAIAPSDDTVRDMVNLVFALESLSAESAQALVPQVTLATIRATAMSIGVRSARQASLTALRINPSSYVSAADAANAQPGVTTSTPAPAAAPAASDGPPLTEIPLPVAIPSQFGELSPVIYVGGNGDENGVRLKLNFETPSLNSLAYPYNACAKG